MDITAIITTVITALVTIFTVIVNSRSTEEKIMSELRINQAVTEEKIKNLTTEVQKHNNFAERIPVIETQLKATNRRIDELEKSKSS